MSKFNEKKMRKLREEQIALWQKGYRMGMDYTPTADQLLQVLNEFSGQPKDTPAPKDALSTLTKHGLARQIVQMSVQGNTVRLEGRTELRRPPPLRPLGDTRDLLISLSNLLVPIAGFSLAWPFGMLGLLYCGIMEKRHWEGRLKERALVSTLHDLHRIVRDGKKDLTQGLDLL